MAEIQELVEAYRQGALSRREFIRRVVMVAGGLAAAVPYLAPLGISEVEAYTYKIYPNAQHAFHNDQGPDRYHPEAAKEAWERTLAFFAQHLKA